MDYLTEASQLDRDIHSLHIKCSFKCLAQEKVHPTQFPILNSLKQLGDCNQCELARSLDTSPASIAVSIKRMEKMGYLIKRPDPTDRRYNRIVLTPQGRLAAEQSEKMLAEIMQQKLSGFSDEELKQYNSYLRRIKDNLERYKKELSAEE